MPLDLPRPLTYLVTSGETTPATTPSSIEFAQVLELVGRAVAAGVSLVQLREKRLTARTLLSLAARCAEITKASNTRLLINDRADIASAALCDGVHLTTQSLEARIVRRTFGQDFLVGVSTHTLEEAATARDGGADFAVLGPIFDTPSKRAYGPPLGITALSQVAHALSPFPLIAIGGITLANARKVIRAGAAGIAAIRLFSDAQNLPEVLGVLERHE